MVLAGRGVTVLALVEGYIGALGAGTVEEFVVAGETEEEVAVETATGDCIDHVTVATHLLTEAAVGVTPPASACFTSGKVAGPAIVAVGFPVLVVASREVLDGSLT